MTSNRMGLDLDGSSHHDLAHVKRFLELVTGDPEFRREARDVPSARPRLLESAGIELTAADLLPFWRLLDPECEDGTTGEGFLDEIRKHPLGELWHTWMRSVTERYRDAVSGWVPTGDPRLAAWRRRRLARAVSEVSLESTSKIVPLFAFELSKGCSTQCWFCALDPPNLQAYFSYTPEHRRLWREVLGAAWDLFGPGCRSVICYHATEPADNPDYFEFLRDVRELLGVHPHTTTARPLKDLAWTRELLRLQSVLPPAYDRFSVLTLASLREIHAVFSAEELLTVDLVFQNRGALSTKALSGRALDQEVRAAAESRLVQGEGPPIPLVGTIECTCGYLVNMVDRSVRLISPCNASTRWPLGYVVHFQGTFRDPVEFRDLVLRGIEEGIRGHLEQRDRLVFREDLAYQPRPDGFVLKSRFREHSANGGRHVALLGELVRDGTFTTGEITDRLIVEGMPALEAISWLDRLHQGGLLAEAGEVPA